MDGGAALIAMDGGAAIARATADGGVIHWQGLSPGRLLGRLPPGHTTVTAIRILATVTAIRILATVTAIRIPATVTAIRIPATVITTRTGVDAQRPRSNARPPCVAASVSSASRPSPINSEIRRLVRQGNSQGRQRRRNHLRHVDRLPRYC